MHIHKRIGLALVASTVAALLAAPIFAEENSSSFAESTSSQKFDIFLRMAMSYGSGVRNVQALNGVLAQALGAQSDEVRVFAKVTDKGVQLRSYLAKNGGQITSRHGCVACVRVPYGALSGMGQLNSVVRIEASRKQQFYNDVAAGAAHGTKLSNLLAHNSRYQGQDVLVGIVDTGIDTTSDAFKDENGKSRILYFWDQNNDDSEHFPTVVTPEGESTTFKYGSEFTAADIDAQSSDNPICTDESGHGTHVSGTAAGRDGQYPGMAPQADLMVVANDAANDEKSVDGFKYLVSRAKELQRPLVVNYSLGGLLGSHDGTTLGELAIQDMVDNNNLILNCAAGNLGGYHTSALAVIEAADTVVVNNTFSVPKNSASLSEDNALEIWSTGSQPLDITVKNGDQASRTIAYGEQITTPENFGENLKLLCQQEAKCEQNGDDHFLLAFLNPGEESVTMPLEIQLHNRSDKPLTVHLYAGNLSSTFQDHLCQGTLSNPSTAPGVICVGAYTTRSQWVCIGGKVSSHQPVDKIAVFSSCGPVRHPEFYSALDVAKPDVVAPGFALISQFSTGFSLYIRSTSPDVYPMVAIDENHIALYGTSMSTPVVTGTVALMLQNMPEATASTIKEALHKSARTDSFTGEVPNDIYGHGKLDAGCVESDLLVSPVPEITSVARDSENRENLVLKGANFVPASDVYLNDVALDNQKIDLLDRNTMVLKGVYGSDSPLLKAKEVTLETVKVVNFLGKKGANTAEYKVGDTPGENPGVSSGSGGCFIATAAYGSYLEPEVMTLRRFRDRALVTNAPGREFVRLYYRYSPPVAAYIAEHPCARFATRVALTPVVYSVSHPATALAMVLALGLGGGLLYRRRRD